MRHAPSLTFVPDAIPEAARHLDELLARARESDAEVAAHREGAAYAGEPDPYRKPREDDEDQLDAWNRRLVDAVKETGRVFLASTRLRGRVALRFCFVNWRTTTADVEEVVNLLRDLGQRFA